VFCFSVSFDDDDPEKGFAFISLKVPDVAEKKGFRGQLKPKEGTIVQPCFKERYSIVWYLLSIYCDTLDIFEF